MMMGNNNKNNSKQNRYFWDGGLLSNTALREVLEAHRNYWFKVKKYGKVNSKYSFPYLEIYVVDLHPTKQDYVPMDHDGVVNRNNDITFHDRTTYDKKVALLVADYLNFSNELIKVAKDNGVSEGAIEVLKKEAKSKHRTGEIRIY
jgi:NTE family protein